MKNYLSLASAVALTVSIAMPALAATKFTEIPANNVSPASLAVSNNGVVALISYPNLYKWSATTGLTNLSELTGSSSDSQLSTASISTDGSVVAFTGNGSQWTDAHIFTSTQNRTISYYSYGATTRLSSDGKMLGGAYTAWNDGFYMPSIMEATGYLVHEWADPIVSNMMVIDLNSTGFVTLLASPPDENLGVTYRWRDAANTIKDVPLGMATDLSNDGKTVIGLNCTVSGIYYRSCSWNSSTGAIKALGNFDAYSTDLNGRVVVGMRAPGVGIIWDAAKGARDIKAVLAAKGINISDWSEISLTDISDDGRYIVGTGKNPSGVTKPFLIQIK